jgi:hypothetical protein
LECNRELSRQYRKENPEKVREQTRRWRARNPEKARAQWTRSMNNLREERLAYNLYYRTAFPDKVKNASRRWRAKNPDKHRNYERRRNTRKKQLPFNFTVDDEKRALEYWHGCCAICGRQLRDLFGETEPQFDHWIPLTDKRPDNPGTVPENMVALCNPVMHPSGITTQ